MINVNIYKTKHFYKKLKRGNLKIYFITVLMKIRSINTNFVNKFNDNIMNKLHWKKKKYYKEKKLKRKKLLTNKAL